jgi:hypothetical protein
MQNAEGGSVPARSNDRYDGVGSIASEIVSSIERFQASTRPVEVGHRDRIASRSSGNRRRRCRAG